MMRFKLLAITVLALAARPAGAQVDRYDPTTGKYITTDPLAPDTPSDPSPYRLNPRSSENIAPQVGQGAIAQAPVAKAGVPATTTGTSVPSAATAPSQQFVPLGDMAMYGDGATPDDPFAKPDWWPQ